MTNIDFLPIRFREQTAKRRTRIWQISIVIAFGAVIASTAILQQSFRRNAAEQLLEVQAKHAAALATKADYDVIQAQLNQVRAQADLYAYLRHPWPRTQVLFEIHKPLPRSMTLTNVSIGHGSEYFSEKDRRSVRDQRRVEVQTDQQTTSSGSPALEDLQLLRQEMDGTPVIVDVSGKTSDALKLQQYVAALKKSPLISKANLLSFESMAGEQQGSSQFELRLELRAGYGQQNGPVEFASTGETASVAIAGGAK